VVVGGGGGFQGLWIGKKVVLISVVFCSVGGVRCIGVNVKGRLCIKQLAWFCYTAW
jgi:hypothetical protein